MKFGEGSMAGNGEAGNAPGGGQPAQTSVATGQQAEQAAAEYLILEKYEVLERNYRRRNCEIDIVARYDGVVYLIEVKYRADDHFGKGLDYIGRDKLKRMVRAAATWAKERRWRGEYVLAAIEVSGPHFEIGEFIELSDV